MPTAVVTGGAGFLGSHLCDHLLAHDYRVICVDNLQTSTLRNLEHIRSDAFVFLYHDVIDPIEIDEPIDVVYHLAALASPIDYLRQPLHSLKVGSYGTHNELAETVLRVTDSKSEIVYEALPVDDPQVRQPDITRARQLGWEPMIELEEGLRRMLGTFERE